MSTTSRAILFETTGIRLTLISFNLPTAPADPTTLDAKYHNTNMLPPAHRSLNEYIFHRSNTSN